MTEESNQTQQVLDTETTQSSRTVDPTALKAYQKYQQKYMEVYGKSLVRKNWKKKLKLKARLVELEAKLARIEKYLYVEKTNG